MPPKREQPSLDGKVVLISGASRGLGLAVAHHCVRRNATVVMCSRSREVLTEARRLRDLLGTSNVVGYSDIDVRNEANVNQIVDFTHSLYGRIDGLVCCAGVYGPIGPLHLASTPDWQDAVATNLFGTMFLCREVVAIMRKQGSGKIVTLSGGGVTRPLPNFSAYAASKGAVVAFSAALAAEVADSGIDVNSVAPGALNTDMLANVLQAGPLQTGRQFYTKALAQEVSGGDSVDNAASLIAFLLSKECDGISGRLISAVWDDWQTLPEHRERLRNSDKYTMARVK